MGELVEREVEAREIEEKLTISLVWQIREKRERELKTRGAHTFLSLATSAKK
jgi:ribosome-binding protein aMBF1 (putative translation factor)